MSSKGPIIEITIYHEGNEHNAVSKRWQLSNLDNIISDIIAFLRGNKSKIDQTVLDAIKIEGEARADTEAIEINIENTIAPEITESEIHFLEADEPVEEINGLKVQTELASERTIDLPKVTILSKEVDLGTHRIESLLPKEGAEMPGNQTKTDIQIIIRKKTLQQAKQHADEDKSRETGGVLLGKFLQSDKSTSPIILVTGIVRALRAVRRSASVNFTPETWNDIWRSIDHHPIYTDERQWRMVGWYHTHPGFGIFLSSMDLAIHHGHFIHPGHIALVIDPKSGEQGFFGWDQNLKEVSRCSENQVVILNDEQLLAWLQDRNLDPPLTELPDAEIELIPGDITQPDQSEAPEDTATPQIEVELEPEDKGASEEVLAEPPSTLSEIPDSLVAQADQKEATLEAIDEAVSDPASELREDKTEVGSVQDSDGALLEKGEAIEAQAEAAEMSPDPEIEDTSQQSDAVVSSSTAHEEEQSASVAASETSSDEPEKQSLMGKVKNFFKKED